MKVVNRLNCYLLMIAGLILIFLMFNGCSGTDKSNRFYELLTLIPAPPADVEDVGLIYLVDYASYREDNNISLSTAEDYIEDMMPDKVGIHLLGIGDYITGHGPYLDRGTIQDKYVGYNLTDFDAEIQVGNPPVTAVAAIGRFDPQATRDALSHQDEWPSWAKDTYVAEEYRGVTIHSWGNGMETHLTTRLVPPHIDNLGRARPLAVTEKYFFYAPRVSIIHSMIDSSQDKSESLADVPEFALVVDGLSVLGAYAALLGDESWANGDPEYEGTYPGPRLKKFETFGSGLGRDEKGSYIALVLVHESSDDASENASVLEQRLGYSTSVYNDIPWSEIITDTHIDVEGKVLLAKLYTEKIGFWSNWIYAQDTLLLHEKE